MRAEPPSKLREGSVGLRVPGSADVPVVARHAAEPESLVGVWMPLGVPAADPELWAAWFVRELQLGWTPLGGRYGGGLAVDLDGAGPAGFVYCTPVRLGALELSYGVAPEVRGRGVATAAVRLAASWALSVGFDRVELDIDASHAESQRVAVKAGFTLMERFQSSNEATGEPHNRLRYARSS